MSESVIQDVLADYGADVQERVLAVLPDKEPRDYLYEPLADYPLRQGKMLRSVLCIAAARCFGAKREVAVCVATFIELLHNSLLVLDDIEDESEDRRGAPALHQKHGLPLALNAGNMLALVSTRPLFDSVRALRPGMTRALMQDVDRMLMETAEGQALELGWRHDNAEHVTVQDYLRMVLKKTCWLGVIFPCRTGALLGEKGPVEPSRFVHFGLLAGTAFQIQDDLMNLNKSDTYGKELCGDLLEGKRTLMLINLLNVLPDQDRVYLLNFLALPRAERTAEDVQWIREKMDETGSIDYALSIAKAMVGAACVEFERAFEDVPDSRDKAFIRQLPLWMLERTH